MEIYAGRGQDRVQSYDPHQPPLAASMSAMRIEEAVSTRSSPGILILDLNNKPLYFNKEALNLLKSLENVPSEVIHLCDKVRSQANAGGSGDAHNGCGALLRRNRESPCSLRAFLIGSQPKGQPATHLLVLIEKATEY
jgi:hypothetical protein